VKLFRGRRAGINVIAASVTMSLCGPAAQAIDYGQNKAFANAIKREAADALPRTALYDTPESLSATKPGALLRQEAFDGYDIPKGARAVRILYHSLDSDEHDVATSAAILIPAGPAPAHGWPVIAWAHGTSGVARQCAPSLMKDVYYGEELMAMVRAGYAVVATDYSGLGTEGAHRYMDRYAQANDVIYSIPAARAAVPELGQGWVADGHSTGGRAVWAVAEVESKRHDTGYLGSIAVAPGVDLRLMSELHVAEAVPAGYYFDYLAYAIHRKTPSFQVSDMLTNQSMARFRDVTTKGCYAYTQNHPDDLEPSEKLKPGWEKAEGAERLFRANEPGKVSLGGPMFIIAGDKDRTIQLVAVKDAVSKACKLGAALNFRIYPGLDHGPTMAKSIPDQLSWIADRFSGKKIEGECGTPGRQ
jgi:Serine aminopeptidase, S33